MLIRWAACFADERQKGRAEGNDVEQPITVNEGVEVKKAENCPLPFTDWLRALSIRSQIVNETCARRNSLFLYAQLFDDNQLQDIPHVSRIPRCVAFRQFRVVESH